MASDSAARELAQEINAYLAEGWSGPRDAKLLERAAEALTRDTSEHETQGLSHALLLKGYRGFADQVDAMARQIKKLTPEVGACSCQPSILVVHGPGTYCGDSQFVHMQERVLRAMQGDNFVSVADAKRIDDVELEAADAIVAEVQSWASTTEAAPIDGVQR